NVEYALKTCAESSFEATNRPLLFGTPISAGSALQTPTPSATQTGVSFNVDRLVEAANESSPMTDDYALKTCVDHSVKAANHPSPFVTPTAAESPLNTPTTNATQTGISFIANRSFEAANKSSLSGTPMAVEYALKTCVESSFEASNQPS
uniref:Uncharacterized protein n=1 Tax=Panagrolaimus sp. PS1159 TaxID=55785 RepID=A0AC35GIP0_9BILA